MRKWQFVSLGVLCVCLLSACAERVLDDTSKDNVLSSQSENTESMSETIEKQEWYAMLEDVHPYSDGYVEVYRWSENDIYRAYFSKSEEQIAVEHSFDGGSTWERTLIPYQSYQYGIYKVYLSFVDENTGYLLYCGEPACGQMSEVLFKTEDGGKSFVEVMDISNQIADYPNDMEFLSEDIGFIIMTYHGNGPIFFQTNDGGITWERQSIELPQTEYAYAQGNRMQKGSDGSVEIVIELVTHEDENKYVTYCTDDGVAWKMK